MTLEVFAIIFSAILVIFTCFTILVDSFNFISNVDFLTKFFAFIFSIGLASSILAGLMGIAFSTELLFTIVFSMVCSLLYFLFVTIFQ